MKTSTFRLLALALLGAGLTLAVSAAEKEAKPADDVFPLSKEAEQAQANGELMATAALLKQHGWGENTKQGWKKVSVESLITAARLLKEIPRPGKLTDEKVVVG